MRLSSLKPGQKGIINSIKVEGAIKRRLMDMGVVCGEEVSIERVAPFGDPIELNVKGYHLSLRKVEANEIYLEDKETGKKESDNNLKATKPVITVAVAGNPNSGKSTLVNALSGSRLQTGNWPGVTVGRSESVYDYKDHQIRFIDLPGTYSLSPYTIEQKIARDFLVNEKPDIILNVVDSTNFERNLLLTIQMLELNIPMVLALNMYDEAQGRDYKYDVEKLTKLLGVKVVPTISTSTKNKGLDVLVEEIYDIGTHPGTHYPNEIKYHEDIEDAIDETVEHLNKEQPKLQEAFPLRWLALKILEQDEYILEKVSPNWRTIKSLAAVKHLVEAHGKNIEETCSNERYGKAAGLAREVLDKTSVKQNELTKTLDALFLNRYVGLPIFLLAMWVMFKMTYDISTPFVDWIDGIATGPVTRWATALLTMASSPSWLISLVTEGVIGGVGFVMVFVPVITAMMFFITLLEASGYMARAAFIMDKFMHSMGLHGNSFIPMLMGFGCNVPAIYATRTLENPKDRIITSLVIPLMSCGARLPVYVLFVSVFFTENAGTVLWSLYVLGIALAVGVGMIFRRTLFKGEQPMFILELPPYRIPTMKNLWIHTWEKAKHFIIKAGTYIFAASIIVWFFLHMPWGVENKKDSFLGQAGQFISPVLKPIGFGNWEAASALLTGIMAKEIVVGTMGEIYAAKAAEPSASTPTFGQDLKEIAVTFGQASKASVTNIFATFGVSSISTDQDEGSKGIKPHIRNTFSPLSAYAFMVFVLLYMPCLVTAAAFRSEFGHWRWFAVSVAYGLVLGWSAAFVIYQGGTLLSIGL